MPRANGSRPIATFVTVPTANHSDAGTHRRPRPRVIRTSASRALRRRWPRRPARCRTSPRAPGRGRRSPACGARRTTGCSTPRSRHARRGRRGRSGPAGPSPASPASMATSARPAATAAGTSGQARAPHAAEREACATVRGGQRRGHGAPVPGMGIRQCSRDRGRQGRGSAPEPDPVTRRELPAELPLGQRRRAAARRARRGRAPSPSRRYV